MRKGGRRSMRWRGFEYASPRSYYVTLCVQGRRCLLGDVCDGRVVPSRLGRIVEETWRRIPAVFKHVQLDACVIMPNHVHAIIRMLPPPRGEQITKRPTLGRVIRYWKTQSALAHGCGFWQRGYYDRVIRDDDELLRARGYIFRNPSRWNDDPENPARITGV